MKTRPPTTKSAAPLTRDPTLARVRASVKYLKAHLQEGIALMVKAGIRTADGRRKKAYGRTA